MSHGTLFDFNTAATVVLASALITFTCVGCKTDAPAPVADSPPAAVAETATTVQQLADQIGALGDDAQVSLLFEVGVSASKIAKVGPSRSELTFAASDLTSAVAFTDRPQRRAFDMTVPMLATLWAEGPHSFANDHPNAVIVDSRSRVNVAVITAMRVERSSETEASVTFVLDSVNYRGVDGQELIGDIQNVHLFIDGLGFKITGAGVAALISNAAKACVSVDCELWPLG